MEPELVTPAESEKVAAVEPTQVAAAVQVVVEPAPAPDPIKADFGASLRLIADKYIKEGRELLHYEPSTVTSEEYRKASLWEQAKALAPVIGQKVATGTSMLCAGLTAVFGLTSVVSLVSGNPGVAISTAIMSTGFGFVTNALWNSAKVLVSEMMEADRSPGLLPPTEPNGAALKV